MVAGIRAGLLGAGAALVLAGCANAMAVPWPTYDPALRAQLASALATRDCATLHALRATANLTSEAHRRSTGYSNEDLVAFIDEALRQAGC